MVVYLLFKDAFQAFSERKSDKWQEKIRWQKAAGCNFMVRTEGIEPSWEAHTPLKRARLPIPPRPHLLDNYIHFPSLIQEKSAKIFFMDKRTLLASRVFQREDGQSLKVNVFLKKGKRYGRLARLEYGELCIYSSTRISEKRRLAFVEELYRRRKSQITQRPFRKEGVYIYRLGKKLYFTSDPKKKGEEGFYYLRKTVKDPLTHYKKDFLSYLGERVPQLGRKRGVDLSLWTLRTGRFQSYYGCCFPKKHRRKFDYRLFAYRQEISDSVIIHEIAHTFEIHHNARFYKIVHLFCPDYDHLQDELTKGYFEGELDNYVY